MSFAACIVSAMAVRKEPSHTTEMVNQLLFGETVAVQEEKEGWWRIKSIHDGYEGWGQSLQMERITPAVADTPITWIMDGDTRGEYIYTGSGDTLLCPLGALLTGFDGEEGSIGSFTYSYNGQAGRLLNSLEPGEKVISTQISKWMNTPYLWGGRTTMGVDCSGFTQTLFRTIGIDLGRDAIQQSAQGEVIDFWQQARCGDLAFFDDKEGTIQHVGILLGPSEIVHAYGKVRKDRMDHEGIINSDTGERTHRLRIIRRYF